MGSTGPPPPQRPRPPRIFGLRARSQQAQDGARRDAVLPRSPLAADPPPPPDVPVRWTFLKPAGFQGTEPFPADNWQEQFGEPQGVAIPPSIFATEIPAPAIGPPMRWRPRLGVLLQASQRVPGGEQRTAAPSLWPFAARPWLPRAVPRADCRRDFCHLSGGAIGPRDLPNNDRAQPGNGFVGLPRTPQLHADVGRAQ